MPPPLLLGAGILDLAAGAAAGSLRTPASWRPRKSAPRTLSAIPSPPPTSMSSSSSSDGCNKNMILLRQDPVFLVSTVYCLRRGEILSADLTLVPGCKRQRSHTQQIFRRTPRAKISPSNRDLARTAAAPEYSLYKSIQGGRAVTISP